MAGLFNKVKAQAASKAPASKKKETVWVVGKTDETKPLAEAVKQFVALEGEAKKLEAKANVFKGVLKGFGEKQYVIDFAAVGIQPETPMQIQTTDGEKVTFVVQDRSSQYGVKPDQEEALKELLGEDAAKDLLFEESTFSFNRDVMSLPGVADVIEKALENAIKKLTDGDKPILTGEVADQLVESKTKTAFKPGTLDRLVQICGRDVARVEALLGIMGSSATRYVKA